MASLIQAIGQKAKNEQGALGLSAALQSGASNSSSPVAVGGKDDKYDKRDKYDKHDKYDKRGKYDKHATVRQARLVHKQTPTTSRTAGRQGPRRRQRDAVEQTPPSAAKALNREPALPGRDAGSGQQSLWLR